MTSLAVVRKFATDMPFSGLSLSALSFLQPAALWALAVLAIPVLIHLFNRSRGRLVKIGHIELVRNARKLKVTELKLADWLLLLLRVSLFALAALILAGLALPGLSSSNKATVYVSPAWLAAAPPQAVAELLQQYSDKKRSRILLLRNDFPALDEQLVGGIRKDDLQPLKISNIWPLLAERLSLEQHQGNVEVYALDNLAQFGPSRPALPREVSWHLSHYATSNASNPMPVTAVVAYDSQHSADAQVLGAALDSLKAHRLSGLSWNLIETQDLAADYRDVDWLILLSDSLAPAPLADATAAPKVVLTDAYGAARRIAPAQLRLPFYPFSEFRVSRTGDSADDQRTLLSLPDNEPLLQQTQSGATREIHFNSRFIPAWSSIAQQPEFPELLLQLLISDEQRENAFAGAGVLPSQLEIMANASDTPLPRRSLQSLLAALMVLLWLPERWLSERKRRAQF